MNALTHRSFIPASVTVQLCIESADLTLDIYGIYEADSGSLVSLLIESKPVSVTDAEKALALLGIDAGSWSDDLDEIKLHAAIDAAVSDALDGYGDYLRDLRDDR